MAYKLAVLGDSLGQGFQDGAVGSGFPERSFPAMIAAALGLSVGSAPESDFRIPVIPGEGLPLDIHKLFGRVQDKVGSDIGLAEWLTQGIPVVAKYFDELEDYYERGDGSTNLPHPTTYHNLSMYGLTVFESMHLTAAVCDELIAEDDGWIADDVLGMPSGARFRAAKMVLDPAGDRPEATQLDNLKRLMDDPVSRPDAVILWLGANDCLGTVVELKLNDMDGKNPTTIRERNAFNLTSEEKFAADYGALAARLDALLPRDVSVFVGTVPDVSVPPIAKGLGEPRDGVYAEYVRFFVDSKAQEAPWLHRRLKRFEVQRIQRRLAAFNRHITALSATRSNWHVVDIGGVLTDLAVRRSKHERAPHEPLRAYYEKKGRPDHPLLALDPIPSLLTLQTARDGTRLGGGLTSLDGVHPTTLGYGIAAEAFLEAMQKQDVPEAAPERLNWSDIIARDRSVQRGPALWDDFMTGAAQCSLPWELLLRGLGSRV